VVIGKAEQIGINIKLVAACARNMIFQLFGFFELLDQGDFSIHLPRLEPLKFGSSSF